MGWRGEARVRAWDDGRQVLCGGSLKIDDSEAGCLSAFVDGLVPLC